MIVANNFFENGIAFFTRLVNTSISWVVANGDVGCFVGHNAFIRWSALQEIAQQQPDGRWQIWSERCAALLFLSPPLSPRTTSPHPLLLVDSLADASHRSQPRVGGLRLRPQDARSRVRPRPRPSPSRGSSTDADPRSYDVRWATYSDGAFEEGVSLTCDDELNRWQKCVVCLSLPRSGLLSLPSSLTARRYAFGVSELLFHPIRYWPTRGILTPMAKHFFWQSNLPLHYKCVLAPSLSSSRLSFLTLERACRFSSFAYMMSYVRRRLSSGSLSPLEPA